MSTATCSCCVAEVLLASAQHEALARHRKARALASCAGCAGANHLALSLEPQRQSGAAAGRKKGLVRDAALERRRVRSGDKQPSEADVMRDADALMPNVLRVLPEELHWDPEWVAPVFATLHGVACSHEDDRRLRGETRPLEFANDTRAVYKGGQGEARSRPTYRTVGRAAQASN